MAILTTHRANNFGAVLQAYSLVEACNELGADAEILDWRSPWYEELYHRNARFSLSIRWPWQLLWKMLIERRTRMLFDVFRQRIRQSQAIENRAELDRVECLYDVFLVGSDQVWNPINSAPGNHPERFDRAYLLDFVKNKPKNSYAASIGVSSIRPDSLVAEFIKAWQTYETITMREHAGAEYVQRLSGHTAEPVLDPVLLHDSAWWSAKCDNAPSVPDRYVFEYNVNQIPELNLVAQGLAEELGCKLVKPIIPAQSSHHNVNGLSIGPEAFVSVLRKAECVASSSFHGAAFALLFRKKLYLAMRQNCDRPNSRYDSLFRYAGVEVKIYRQFSNVLVLYCDFAKMDTGKFEKECQRSRNILREILS